MQRFLSVLVLLACCAVCAMADAAQANGAILWRPWNESLFDEARAQQRFVLLDLEAVWCHWCHVMDETTYEDRAVARLIGQQYIAVRVDQDSNPALSLRYQDYGWPATIVLAADGSEIVKRRGYLSPAQMASMLTAIIKDPSPGPSVTEEHAVQPTRSAILGAASRKALLSTYYESYDAQYAGWGSAQKFIDADSLEYALAHARSDPKEAAMARNTLNAAIALIDPVWGGVYQYSDQRDWKSPHFEKLMSFQSGYMRLYAEGYRLLADPAYLKAAQDIDRYVQHFLTAPDGALYTSQDADVNEQLTGRVFYAMSEAQRHLHATPPVDTHSYARENGWAIAAWVALYDASGDARYLARARRTAAWTSTHRQLGSGGFSHAGDAAAPPSLGDTLAMGQGTLALYASSGDRAWLGAARQAAHFIDSRFALAAGGYVTVAASAGAHGVFRNPVRDVDENIGVARFANSLNRYSGAPQFRAMAEHAMHYLASAQIVDGEHLRTGILLADSELASAPMHVTIIGHKDDAQAQSLHSAALRFPSIYRRIDWWDKLEGAMPNPDVRYPGLARAAAFVCSANTCSLPAFDAKQLTRALEMSTSAE